jgi:hypothetical protein
VTEMRVAILAIVGGLALAASAQATPLARTPIPAANVVRVQGWPNWQWGWQGGPGRGQDHERREHCWRLRHQEHEIRERIYLTLHLGSGAGWSITSGKLESSSEASVGAF